MGLFDTIKKAFTTPGSAKKREQKSKGGSTTNRSAIEKAAAKVWNNSAAKGRDTNIVKSAPQLNDRGLTKPPVVQAGGFSAQNKINKSLTGSQFGGMAQDARKIYEQQTAFDPNNLQSWKELGQRRAKGESEVHRGMQDLYFTNGLDDDTHRAIIGKGEDILGGEAAEKYLALDDIKTYEDLAAAEERYTTYKKYMDRYYIERSMYNSDSAEFETHYVIRSDAPLPPWVEQTKQNLNEWEYYKGFQSETGTILHDKAMDLWEEQEKFRDHPYKSAFNMKGDENLESNMNSALEVLIGSIKPEDENDTRSIPKRVFDNYKDYVRDYHINPLLAGKYGTVLGNHIWNLMDTMDVAARGMRAFTAGKPELGSYHGNAGNGHVFEGQDVFWVNLEGQTEDTSKLAQTVFLENGGRELLKLNNANRTDNLSYLDSDKLKAQIAEAFEKQPTAFGDKGVTWEDVYESIQKQYYGGEAGLDHLKQSIENVKETYTNPEATFNADTGSTVENILIETILDPGLLIGGSSKAISRTSAAQATDTALRDVLKVADTLPDNELIDVFASKDIKKAIRTFRTSNEGRNIIFKNTEKLEADIKGLSRVFSEAGVFSDNFIEKNFQEAMLNALVGRRTEIQGKVIGAQAYKEIQNSRRLAQVAASIDLAVDSIDMAIIKGAFIEPVVASKMFKGLNPKHFRAVRNVMAANKLKAADAANAANDELRASGAIGQLKTYLNKYNDNLIAEKDLQEKVRGIRGQFTTAASRIEDVQNRLSELTPDEAMREVAEIMKEITGEADNTLTSLDTLIKELRKNYSLGGDLEDVFDILKRAHSSFSDAISRQDGVIRKAFIDQVRNARSADELALLVREYSDSLNMQELRTTILDNIPSKKLIPEEDLNKILDDLSTGLLAERSIREEDIKLAEAALPDAATKSHRVSTTASEVSDALKELPTLNQALMDSEKYPFLDRLAAKLYQVSDMPPEAMADAHFSTKRIINEIINAHAALSEGRALKNTSYNKNELKKISDELIELKVKLEKAVDTSNAEIITTYHMDKQAKYDSLINNSKFSRLFDKTYEKVFKPAIDLLDSKIMQGTDAFGNSKIYEGLMAIEDLRYSYQRYRRFVHELDMMDIPDEAKYAIRNGLFGCYGESNKKLIEVTRQPGKVRKWLNTMMYNEYSSSQVGMDTLTAKLRSLDSAEPDAIIADYADDIRANPNIYRWYQDIINGDPADPSVYVQKQVLSTILMDPKSIERFNAYDQAPIFVHVSTSGLSDDAAITGISYYKWNKIDVDETGKPSIQAIYDALHTDGSSDTFLRVMDDTEIEKIDEDVLYGIYKNSPGERSLDITSLRSEYKKTFGVTEGREVNSEAEMLEEFFSSIYGDTYTVSKRGLFGESFDTVVPTFVVHDLDGFNMPFINRRAERYGSEFFPRTLDYSQRLSGRAANNSLNTFEQLRAVVNDKMLSEEEMRTVEEFINNFAQDLSTRCRRDFSMLDIEGIPDRMQAIADELDMIPATAEEDDVIKALRNTCDSKEVFDSVQDAKKVISDLEVLDDEANQIASVTDPRRVSANGNLGNTVRNASQTTGERMLNVDDRYDLRNIRRFFSLGDIENGVQHTYHDIDRMASVARYVDEKLRYSIRSGAEVFLRDYKDSYDKLIKAVKNLALTAPNTDGYFGYLKYLEIPQTATESYLICQKLYDDLLKYWLNSALVHDFELFQQFGKASDRLQAGLRERLLAGFVDGLGIEKLLKTNKTSGDVLQYVNLDNMTDRSFGEMLRLLEGEGQSMVFKDVPPEYLRLFDTYGTHGKIKDGVDFARKLRRGYTQMKGIIREQEYLDSVLRAAGIETKEDFALGLMFTHTADLMDLSKNGDMFTDGKVRYAMRRISDLHVMRVHNTRMRRLMNGNKFSLEKVISELLYNNANHILFQKAYFRDYELKRLRGFVRKLNKQGLDYIKIAEDRGSISIYLTNKCEICRVFENGREMRYVHKLSDGSYGTRYFKLQLEYIALPTQEELLRLDFDEMDDSFWAMYNKLRECWTDVSLMSDGASNGTLGRVVFPDDMDEYYKTADALMPDLISNKGMREARMYGNTMYDPGFMLQGDYDILTDYFHTMQVQAENFKASGALLNNVFGSGNEFNFNQLAEYASDEELAGFLNASSDFVLCSLVPAKDTKLGLRVRQLKTETAADIAIARELSNTTLLPYDVYLDMADAINVKEYTSDLNRAINKLMLVYKAGALFHPGTWVRNFIDATQKATTDLEGSPLSIFDTFFYELKCMKDIHSYQKMLRYGNDFLTEANWDVVKHVTGANMSYENFQLLRGMFDSNQYVSKAQWRGDINRMKSGGREVLSGDSVGLNNLSERDITKAFSQTKKHAKINMDQKRFMEIYMKLDTPANDVEAKLYADTMRAISNYMHSAKAIFSLTNAVHASFIPFNIGEMTVRYAQMSRLNDLGFSNNQALRRVHLTQFKQAEHYGIPNKLEYIVPFITFKYNNLKYWMRMMEENPAYFKYFEKLYGNVVEDTVEMYHEKGQQLDAESNWMLKSGGLPIGNGKYYFKINPSLFDALQTVYGFPSEMVSNQNPLLRIATRGSMYELGLSMKYIFSTLNLNPEDVNQDLSTIFSEIAPRFSKIQDVNKITKDGFMTWVNGLGPNMETLYKLIPSLIGKNYFDDYNASTFEDYQKALEASGLWYDCNTGQVVDISQKNEKGMNAPSQSTEGVTPEDNPISWMDVNNYMMVHFNKIWDANVGKFVPFWEQTEGGLNQKFDFVNDPTAWNRLCDEMLARKGKKFDYNKKHFVPVEEWHPAGLNDPNLSFEERVELMAEKFPDLKWDANQNTFVEGKDYIAGGLNDVSNFRDVMLFRYALFGQTYNRDTHHFEDTDAPKIVKLSDLYKLDGYNNYYAMLGIPKLMDVTSEVHLDSNGLLVTADGRYVLMSDPDYNQRVFNQIRSEYGGMFSSGYRGRRYNGYKRYAYNKTRRPKTNYVDKTYYTGFGWNEEQGYYRLSYEYSFQYHNPQPAAKLNRLISPPIIYPYGGGYGKFSYYAR